MSIVVNPVKISITDPNVTLENVTSFTILVGTVSGGPYTTSSASVPLSSLTPGANGLETEPFSALTFSPALKPFTTYFCVAEAVNAQGVSGNSPEVSFSLASVPSAPTALSFS